MLMVTLCVLCLIQVLTLVVRTGTAALGRFQCCCDQVLNQGRGGVWTSQRGWWEGPRSEVGLYSPNRAGVRLGVMGASSFRPGVQIFTALNQKMAEIHYQRRRRDSGSCIDTSSLRWAVVLKNEGERELKMNKEAAGREGGRGGVKKQTGVSAKSAGK